MASLGSKGGHIEATLKIAGVEERGTPLWLRAHLSVETGQATLVNTSLAITFGDVERLVEAIESLETRPKGGFESQDADFIVDLDSLDVPGDIAVGLWVGEPYDVMRGVRFVSTFRLLSDFGDSLLREAEGMR